jgi:hypothetical protein
MTGLGGHIAREPVDRPGLALEYVRIQILQRNGHPYGPRIDFPNVAVISRRAGYPAGMDQNGIADFEIRSIFFEFKSE